MDLAHITTPLAALTAGAVTSVHCSAMCGPLGCALLTSKNASPCETQIATAVYHSSRLISYSLIGGVLGAIGLSAGRIFDGAPTHLLPWAFALVFIVIGFGLDRWIPQPRFLSAIIFKANLKLAGSHRAKAGALLGLLTPFLPCGPLYLVFGVALFSGSFASGVSLMAAFALGTLPLFWLLQSQLVRFQMKLSPAGLVRVRRGLALVSALIVCWRVAVNDGAGMALLRGISCH